MDDNHKYSKPQSGGADGAVRLARQLSPASVLAGMMLFAVFYVVSSPGSPAAGPGVVATHTVTFAEDGSVASTDAIGEAAGDALSAQYPQYDDSTRAQASEELVSPVTEPEEAAAVLEAEGEGDDGEQEKADDYDDDGGADNGALFQDQEAFDNAPVIQVLPESKIRKYSKIVLSHERYHREHPSRLYVPRLRRDSKLSAERFKKLFMDKSQPVIIPFDAMRHLNFTSTGFTLAEMAALYPNSSPMMYKYGSILAKQLDLGPAVAQLMSDKKLRKTATGKSYPRNTKINLSSLERLNLQLPPVIPDSTNVMLPSLWFGPTSAATPLHSDCCDNWAMMVAGTKRWTVAPPSEARILKPACQGGLCWVKRLPHADEHATGAQAKKIRDSVQFVTFDLAAGEFLYLPAGWFHHVENIDGTVMVNIWSKAGPAFLKYYSRLVRGDVTN